MEPIIQNNSMEKPRLSKNQKVYIVDISMWRPHPKVKPQKDLDERRMTELHWT
jgi:hypothetical protein